MVIFFYYTNISMHNIIPGFILIIMPLHMHSHILSGLYLWEWTMKGKELV